MKHFYANGGGMDFLKRLSKPDNNNSALSLKPRLAHTFFLDKESMQRNQGVGCSPKFSSCLLKNKNSPPTGGSNSLFFFTSPQAKLLTATHPKADGRACDDKDSWCSRNVWPIEQDLFGSSLTSVRQFFGYAPRFLRDLFETCSTGLRLLFGYSSTRSRRTVEAHPKDSRSCPEAVSNLSRSGVEDHSKKTKRKVEEMDRAMCEFVRYEKASNPITTQAQPKDDPRTAQETPNNHPITRLEIPKDGLSQTLSKTFLRNVYTRGAHNKKLSNIQPTDRENTVLKQGRGTAVPLLSYCSPTKVALQSCYGSTKELLNTYVLVTPQYNSSRSVVVPKTKGSVSIAKYVKLIASKCLRPIAYGLMLILVSMFSLSDAWAQSAETRTAEGQTDIKPLQIGDTIPEELWNLPLQVINHPDGKDTITLNDYRDKKLIILDFWSTWCGSCIAGFPKFIELQKKFSEDMAFVPVTYQREDDIAGILAKHPNFRGLISPIAVDDKALGQYFPHLALPHVVWIDPAGKLQGLTSSQHITELSIREFFGKEKLDWAVKDEDAVLMDTPIVSTYERDKTSIYNNGYQYSFLSGYTTGLPRYHLYSKIDTITGYKVVRFANHSLYNLYMRGLGKFITPIHENLIVIEGQRLTLDRLKFRDTIHQTSDNWYKENGFTYELRVPITMDLRSISRRLIQDLNAYLDMKVTFEDRIRDCWVLKVVDPRKFEKIKSTGGDKVEKLITDDPVKVLRNVRIEKLVDALNYLNIAKRVVNDVEDNGLVDLQIDAPNLLDIASLNKAIEPYGLRFYAEDRLINVLVFKEVLSTGGGI